MASIGYATLQVIPSLKGFNARLRTGIGGSFATEGGKAGENAGRSFASTFAKFAAGATAIAGIAALGKNFYDAAIESQKVTKQTEAVLKSMGDVAGVTAKDVSKLSEELSLKSGVDDELIQNAQNVLLTFGKVRNEVGKGNKIFDRASKSALDMSVALGTDLQGATIQVGKALNDPIKGITALSRAGVSFSEEQKKLIRSLVETGDTLGAQKVILGELEKQFGGSAAAQATAADKLKVVWGNLQEQLGSYLIPIVERVATWLAENLPAAMEATERFVKESLVPALENLWTWFKDNILPILQEVSNFITEWVIPALQDFAHWLGENDTAARNFAIALGIAAAIAIVALAPFWAIAAAAVLIGAGLYYAYTNWGWFKTGVDGAVSAVKIANDILSTLYDWLQKIITGSKKAGESLGNLLDKIPGVPDLSGPIGWLTSAAAKGARNAIPGVGPILELKDLLGFDEGGTVPGRIGAPKVVLAHGGETILPTHKSGMTPLPSSYLGTGGAMELSVAPGWETAAGSWFLRYVRINRGARNQLRSLVGA